MDFGSRLTVSVEYLTTMCSFVAKTAFLTLHYVITVRYRFTNLLSILVYTLPYKGQILGRH